MPRWSLDRLCQKAKEWFVVTRKQKITASEKSPWWSFAFEFPRTLTLWVTCFVEGSHGFSPLKTYRFPDEVVQVWEYCDKLFVHLIYGILKPTFKAVISKRCYHLKGPSVIRFITQQIKQALSSGDYRYAIRLDIKSYFASIDHEILLQQIEAAYDDPNLKKYLRDIITIGIDRDGLIDLPHKGIPIRSSLSPFFGALYLKPLDEAFENRENCLFLRYMDDVLILVKTQRQYQRAKKRIFKILRELRLKLSPHKTWMGKLEREFHFLGVSFDPTRIGQSKENQTPLVSLHSRSYQRALDKLKAMREDAVHPAKMQSYLSRWALWWYSATGTSYQALINRWRNYTEDIQANLCWIGSGLLLGTSFDRLNRCFNNTSCLKTVV